MRPGEPHFIEWSCHTQILSISHSNTGPFSKILVEWIAEYYTHLMNCRILHTFQDSSFYYSNSSVQKINTFSFYSGNGRCKKLNTFLIFVKKLTALLQAYVRNTWAFALGTGGFHTQMGRIGHICRRVGTFWADLASFWLIFTQKWTHSTGQRGAVQINETV